MGFRHAPGENTHALASGLSPVPLVNQDITILYLLPQYSVHLDLEYYQIVLVKVGTCKSGTIRPV